MVDDVKDITETAESKASQEALDRARLARERREAEQRKRLDELRAHAAAAQAQREKRDEDRRRRQAEQRAKDDERRVQVEERKRAIWEASISRREALLQRERDRTERLERQRAARSAPRPAFAFGSSTPRLLEPVDSAGFFWAARRAASTTNVMFASAPLTRRASALQLDSSDTDNKDEPDRSPQPVMWSSVARRRTDLVPTVPAPRAPGRAYSMTRLDRLPASRPLHSASPSMHHLNRAQTRSGDTTPGSRPGSALSNATGVVRRPTSAPRKPRPASIAGTGVNTPRGGGDTLAQSAATTPSVSRDSTVMAGGDVPRRAHTTPRRPRPASLHTQSKPAPPVAPGDGKPPVHRKPKPSKDHDKAPRGKSLSASPGRTLSPSPAVSKESSVDKEVTKPAPVPVPVADKSIVDPAEVTHKLEALQIQNGDAHHLVEKVNEIKETIEVKQESKIEQVTEVAKHEERVSEKSEQRVSERSEQRVSEKPEQREKKEDKEDKKEPSVEKTDDNEMTASMTARRITTEEQAKAALAERRRRAREELERQAELERQRLQREAEEEAERQRQEEERQRREEEEARELAQLQRQMNEEKLRKAIEAQQQLEREEAERKVREEVEKQARLKEDEEKRKAAEEAEKLRREEAEKEEKERLARKQRVEAIMARTRLRKQAEEDKSKQAPPSGATAASPGAAPVPAPVAAPVPAPAPVEPAPAPEQAAPPPDNGNAHATADLLGLDFAQPQETNPVEVLPNAAEPAPAPVTQATPNNGNVTADLLGLSEQLATEDKTAEQTTTPKPQTNDNATITNTPIEANNGNSQPANIGHISANFIQSERLSNENQTKMADVPKLLDDDFTTHNGHGATHNHPLTLQNAI